MTQEKVDAFILSSSKYFPPESIMMLREKLLATDESRLWALQSTDFKDPTTILIVSVLIGGFGVDRFMLGDTGMGILKLLTSGLCGILTIIDWFTCGKKAKEVNLAKIMSIL